MTGNILARRANPRPEHLSMPSIFENIIIPVPYNIENVMNSTRGDSDNADLALFPLDWNELSHINRRKIIHIHGPYVP